MLDAAAKVRLNEALEKVGGNRGLACVAMGLAPDELRRQINSDTDMKLAWGMAAPPSPPNELQVFHRPSNTDHELAEAFLKEDQSLALGLSELGLNDQEQKLARALRKFHSKHFFASMDMIGAGVTRTALKLQTEMERIEARLIDVRLLIAGGRSVEGRRQAKTTAQHKAEDEKGTFEVVYEDLRTSFVEEEKALLYNYIAIADQLRKMFEISNRSTLLLAGIRLKMLGKKDVAPPRPPGKPGFSPTEY